MGRSIGLLNKGVDILLGTPEKKHHEHVSPIIIAQREDASEVKISVYEYNETFIENMNSVKLRIAAGSGRPSIQPGSISTASARKT
jgi:hypothetical protein